MKKKEKKKSSSSNTTNTNLSTQKNAKGNSISATSDQWTRYISRFVSLDVLFLPVAGSIFISMTIVTKLA